MVGSPEFFTIYCFTATTDLCHIPGIVCSCHFHVASLDHGHCHLLFCLHIFGTFPALKIRILFRTKHFISRPCFSVAQPVIRGQNQPSVIHQNLSPCLIPRSFHLLIIFSIMICSPVALHLLPGPVFLRQDSAGALILDAFVNAGPDQHCLCL